MWMSAGCPNRSTVSHIIISSHQLTGFSTLCLAATSSEAERIPLDYPKHLTCKWGVRRTLKKKNQTNNSWTVQWANSTSDRDTQISSRLWGKRSISCACPRSADSKFLICAQSLISKQRQARWAALGWHSIVWLQRSITAEVDDGRGRGYSQMAGLVL